MNLYLDVPGFQEMVSGIDTTDMLLASAVLTAPCAIGATSLAVNTSAGFVVGRAFFLDGITSERIKITGQPDGTHITCAPTQYAHPIDANIAQGPQAFGVPDGSSLPQALVTASAWVESYTQRVLLLASYSNEVGNLKQDKNGALLIKPYQWPVTSFTGLSIVTSGATTNLDISDPTKWKMVSGERTFLYTGTVPTCRNDPGYIQISYTSGFNPMQEDIREACALYAFEVLNREVNYMGASAVQIDHTRIETRLRGDDGFDTPFIAKAKENLNSYVRRD